MHSDIVKWLLLAIAGAIVAWIVSGFLDAKFTPLSEEEIIGIMHEAQKQSRGW